MDKISVSEIKNEYAALNDEGCISFAEKYRHDERPGVVSLVKRADKRHDALLAEKARMKKMFEFEEKYSAFSYICGIDEVGRGPFAGPVVAGAVILPKNCSLLYLNDSKQLSEKKREELFDMIINEAVSYGLGQVSNERIDEVNILNATYEAMRQAISKLDPAPDLLLNDAVNIPGLGDLKQVPIIKGDTLSASIAAASIIAKVTRDRLMVEYDSIYPGYGFAKNKGYGSADHIKALKELGPTPIHRRSFIHNYI